jgi:hypothetical protein
VFPICERLKLAAQRLARLQAAKEMARADEFRTGFTASGLWLAYIIFGLTSRIGQGGWQQPWFNIMEPGCDLPVDDMPWGNGFRLFVMPRDAEIAKQRALIEAQS